MKPIRVLPNNPSMEGICTLIPNVEFACPDGISLKLHLIMPLPAETPAGSPAGETIKKRYPLIVFVQGSAWVKPNQNFEIPQLSWFARRGYVIATVTHRTCFEAAAPAFLQDVKSSIRFLRAHADEYSIDPERVAIWGTSSGGNTALLVGVTGGMPELDAGDNLDQSSEVKAVVDCFGPTDLVKMATKQYVDKNGEPVREGQNIFEALAGHALSAHDLAGLEPLRRISPISYVEPGKNFPSFFILHGDADPVVLYEDSVAMYEKLIDCGYDAEMLRVTGAPHEGSFWSRALHEEVAAFLDAHL